MIPITSCVHGDANGDLDVVVSGFTWLLRSGESLRAAMSCLQAQGASCCDFFTRDNYATRAVHLLESHCESQDRQHALRRQQFASYRAS